MFQHKTLLNNKITDWWSEVSTDTADTAAELKQKMENYVFAMYWRDKVILWDWHEHEAHALDQTIDPKFLHNH